MSSEQSESLPWMDYFKSILNKYEGHANLKLQKFHVGSGANKGENFASAVFRVTLNYLLNDNPKESSFIVKTTSQSNAVSEMLGEMGVFDGEQNIYEKILPQCEKAKFKIAPRLVHTDNNALVMEDLNQFGYKLANRKERLDLPHAKLVLEKLAKFHAVTSVMESNEPESMKLFMKSAIDSEEMTPLTFFFAVSMQETIETVKNTPELQKFLPRLESFNIVEREINAFRRHDSEKFRVLNHGDMWLNNVFFSYNEANQPVDSILVDYQECFWGSPGIDLNHFLYTSCDFDIHDNHIDQLIAFYHSNLVTMLKQLKATSIPTIDEIKNEFEGKVDQALVCLCSIVPVMMIENTEHANPENFIAEGEKAAEIRRIVYGNEKFVEVLKFLLPKIFDRGIE